MESAPRFFAKKVPELHNTEEVVDAVEKHTRLTGEKVPNTSEAKLGVYMERLENIFLNENEDTRKRNIEMLRENIHDAFVIKREEVPESYFELQQRIARERGQAVETIPEKVREQMKDVIIEDQTKSLDDWVNYLTSNDAMYPTWFKYLAFRNIVRLSQFDKELGKFKERTKSTTAPFPDIYREALAQLCDVYEKAAASDKEALKDPAFQEFVAKKFPTQYAEFVLKNLEQSQENKEEIKGQWVKYEQGDMEGAKRLYESLQGKGTGWCTAGESTARYQIENGDFYVYYTNDTDGNPIIPRLAIRMEYEGIGEVRGVLEHQEVEPQLQEVLDAKFAEFGPEADLYRKKSLDMKRLTDLGKRIEQGEVVTRVDLEFLFEADENIKGFGYEADPRIEEYKVKLLDRGATFFAEVLALKPEEVAMDIESINPHTVLLVAEIDSYLSTGEKGRKYKKRLSDTHHFNVLKGKIMYGGNFSKDELRFLYQQDEFIEIFGYTEDVESVASAFFEHRDIKKDVAVILEVPEQVVSTNILDCNNETQFLALFNGSDNEESSQTKEHLEVHDITSPDNKFLRTALIKCTELAEKTRAGKELSLAELGFIWEIYLTRDYKDFLGVPNANKLDYSSRGLNLKLSGISNKSLRIYPIDELKKLRNRKQDLSTLAELDPKNVAENQREIHKGTKGYLPDFKDEIIDIPSSQIDDIASIVEKITALSLPFRIELEAKHGILDVNVADINFESINDLLSHFIPLGPHFGREGADGFLPEVKNAPCHKKKSDTMRTFLISIDPDDNHLLEEAISRLYEIGLRPVTFSEFLMIGVAKPQIFDQDSNFTTIDPSIFSENGNRYAPLINYSEYQDEDMYEPNQYLELTFTNHLDGHLLMCTKI